MSTSKTSESLKYKVILPIAALFLVVAGIVVAIVSRYLDSARLSDARYRSEIIAYAIQYTSEVAGASPELSRMVQVLGTERDIKLIKVVSLDSRKIVASNRFAWQNKDHGEITQTALHREILDKYADRYRKDIASLQGNGVIFTYASVFPLKNLGESGAVEKAAVIVDLDTSEALFYAQRRLLFLIVTLAISVVLLTALVYLLLAYYIFKPVDSIMTTLNERAEGVIKSFAKIFRPDEIGLLASSVNSFIDSEENNIQTLKEREQELQLIFDNVPVRIWYKDDKNTILRLNRYAADSMGMAVVDVEGKNTADLFPEMADKYLQDDLEVIRSGEPRLDIVEKYTPINAEPGWVKTDKVPYQFAGTSKRGVLVVAQDITKLKSAEVKLQEYTDELERSNKELDEFAYIASHDLKSPLRGIDHLATWIAEDIEAGKKDAVAKNLSLMRGRVQRMEKLLSDLLEYSQVGRQQEKIKRVDVKLVVEDIFQLVSSSKSLTLEVEGDLPIFTTIAAPFEQVLMNLISNAVKHHDRANGKIQVSCDDDQSGFFHFYVKDNGPGIDDQYHELIFKMFKSLKSRDEVEGSGMGLALIKKIVTTYGGDIGVASKVGEGCSFRFSWPKNMELKGTPNSK